MLQRFALWDPARAPVHLYIHYTVGGIVKLDPGFRAGGITLQVLVGYFILFLMSDFKGGVIRHLHLHLLELCLHLKQHDLDSNLEKKISQLVTCPGKRGSLFMDIFPLRVLKYLFPLHPKMQIL